MAEQHGDKDQQDYLIDQARAIRDEIEVPVFGPAGHTPPCAEAWPTAKLIAGLLYRIEALEARNEGDKEALAAMRKAGISAALRVKALQRRIDTLEANQPPQPNHPAKPDSSLVERVEHAIYRSGNQPGFRAEARAAIREVAAWPEEQKSYGHGWAAITLEQEAER